MEGPFEIRGFVQLPRLPALPVLPPTLSARPLALSLLPAMRLLPVLSARPLALRLLPGPRPLRRGPFRSRYP